MKLINAHLLAGIILLWPLLASCQLSGTEADAPARELAKPDKLPTFGNFVTLFNKHYPSALDMLARQKLFLKRVAQCFLSFFKYVKRLSPIYLGVNSRSDWTEEELNRARVPIDRFPVGPREEKTHRSKRSVSTEHEPGSELDLSELMGAPDARDESKQLEDVPSNNPNYEAPNLTNLGDKSDVDQQMQPLPRLEAQAILSQASSFYSDLVSFSSDALSLIGSLISMVTDHSDHRGEVSVMPSNEHLEDGSNSVDDQGQPNEEVEESEQGDKLFIDHRNCLLPPEDQGMCNSCYIFCGITLLEWRYCKETNKKVSLSKQYVIDCGLKVGMSGCHGGRMEQLFSFSYQYGLELGTTYPYKARDEECPLEMGEEARMKRGYLRIGEFGFGELSCKRIEALKMRLSIEPLAISIRTRPHFEFYRGGVDEDEGDCGGEFSHAMVLVGLGREDGKEYWLMRNSYGPDWGQAGYYKLSTNYQCWTDSALQLLGEEKYFKVNTEYPSDLIRAEHDALQAK